jgi:putative flippase GtrA
MKLVIKYSLFALIATAINLGTQWLVLLIRNDDLWLLLALFAGTATGLVAKYILDKRWIFYYQTSGAKDDAERFTLYTVMGLLTTAIFWGMELSFHYLLANEYAKYIGGALGLSIGYYIKYQLDKRFVFTQPNANRTAN